jgi:hypothetical protein
VGAARFGAAGRLGRIDGGRGAAAARGRSGGRPELGSAGRRRPAGRPGDVGFGCSGAVVGSHFDAHALRREQPWMGRTVGELTGRRTGGAGRN